MQIGFKQDKHHIRAFNPVATQLITKNHVTAIHTPSTYANACKMHKTEHSKYNHLT